MNREIIKFRNKLYRYRRKAILGISECETNPSKLFFSCMQDLDCGFFWFWKPSSDDLNQHMPVDYGLNDNSANLSDVNGEASSLRVGIANVMSRLELEYQRVQKIQTNCISIASNNRVMCFLVSRNQPSRTYMLMWKRWQHQA